MGDYPDGRRAARLRRVLGEHAGGRVPALPRGGRDLLGQRVLGRPGPLAQHPRRRRGRLARSLAGQELPRHPAHPRLRRRPALARPRPGRPRLDPLHRRAPRGDGQLRARGRPDPAAVPGPVGRGPRVRARDVRHDEVGTHQTASARLPGRVALPRLRRRPAAARGAGRHVRRARHRRPRRAPPRAARRAAARDRGGARPGQRRRDAAHRPAGPQRAGRRPRAGLPVAGPRRPDPVGRRAAAATARHAAAVRACSGSSTCSTSRRPACTPPTPRRCSRCCWGCATPATACSSSSTTSTWSVPPTGWSTSGRGPAAAAAWCCTAGRSPGCRRWRRRSPGATSPPTTGRPSGRSRGPRPAGCTCTR